MTAHALAGYREECLAAGMNDYVTKPIEPEDLFKVLAKWVKTKQRAGEVPTAEIPESYVEDAPQSVTCLPDSLPGIDLQLALKRLGGNHRLVRQLLERFEQEQAHFFEMVQAALKRNDWQEAERLIHTMKGVSGNLSATDLHQAAINLEKGILWREADRFTDLLAAFQTSFEQVIATSRSLQTDSQNREKAGEVPGAQVPMAELEPLLEELAEQIRSYSPDAQDILEKLKAKLHGQKHPWESQLADVEEKLRVYDFKGAMAVLNSVKT
jgi:polar amino acid transport system substrate-binding protein